MTRRPLPPFTLETAMQKVRLAEDAWNSRDPARVAPAYTADSRRRNRSQCLQGHDDSGRWYRSYGNERRAFNAHGPMPTRIASVNGLPTAAGDRKFPWPAGRRPDEHAGRGGLGL